MILGPVKVLLIEDDPSYGKLLEKQLKRSESSVFEPELVDRLSRGIDRLCQGDYDVLLLDLVLPDSSGAATFERAKEKALDTPIVVLTGMTDESLPFEILGLGAQDYLIKSEVNPALLTRSLLYAIERKRLELDLARQKNDLEALVSERTLELVEEHALLKTVVAERKEAEEALRESEEKFRALFEQAGNNILLLDPNRDGPPVIVDANAAACRIQGFTYNELIGKSISDLEKQKYGERIREKVRRILSGEHLVFDTVGLRKDGSSFPVEVSAKLLQVAGKPPLILAVQRDITERKRVEEALRESEKNYRNIFETSILGVYTTTPDGKILAANPASVDMLGYASVEELRERNLEDTGFEPSYSRNDFKEAIESNGEVKGLESEWVRVDGRVIHIRENARAVRNDAGEVVRYEGMVADPEAEAPWGTRAGPADQSPTSPTPRSSVGQPRFVAWGFNYDHDRDGRLLEDYWRDEWVTVESDFREMRALGANVVRVHLQVSGFMQGPREPNRASLKRLAGLLKLAEKERLYLDITGLGCYHKQDVPEWYDALDKAGRWEVQALFWEAVAKTCAGSRAVFCYDLMNEPILPGKEKKEADWLAGEFAGKYFVQRIALDLAGRTREQVAKAWIDRLVQAIRKHDDRHMITVGVIPWAHVFPGAKPLFYSKEVGENLDFVSVHFYPEKDGVDKALKALEAYEVGKPLVVEETFPLKCGVEQLDAFIERSRRKTDGWIGFYWGATIEEYAAKSDSIPDAIVKGWLEYFREKGPEIVGHKP